MSELLECPMHPKPYPQCSADGKCPVCRREWSVDDEGNMISKMRKVKVVGPLEIGGAIDKFIVPIDDESAAPQPPAREEK